MKVRDLLSFNRRFYTNVDSIYEAELIEYLNIDTQKRFKELSQGNRKKVGILHSVVHKPDYLIMDEPTNGLDPLLQEKLYQLLSKEKAGAWLYSSHLMFFRRQSASVSALELLRGSAYTRIHDRLAQRVCYKESYNRWA